MFWLNEINAYLESLSKSKMALLTFGVALIIVSQIIGSLIYYGVL